MESIAAGPAQALAIGTGNRLVNLVNGFMAAWVQRDVNLLRPWIAENCVLLMPPTGPIEGARRVLAAFRIILRNNFKEVHWKVTDIYPVSPNRCIYATDSWGIICKDVPYKNALLTIIDFDSDGRITYISDYFKDTAVFARFRAES
jgi:hypothetical protein